MSVRLDGRDGRRTFLRTAVSAAGLTVVGCAGANASGRPERDKHEADEEQEAEVTPGEDLMQEHGVLERILLVYDEGARRIEAGEKLDLGILATSAGIVSRFVEGYHEKNEEQFVFPRLEAAKREVDLVATLLRQHERGRAVTADITRLAGGPGGADLAKALRSFVRMYRPHAAREDTVLFPAFREVIGRAGYHELGEQLEDREHQLFGEHGFEKTVAEVAALEEQLGIGDLATFTP
jgi:hemerythrin-like domain-containing protein